MREQSSTADSQWLKEWSTTVDALFAAEEAKSAVAAARRGLLSVRDYLSQAHAIALNGVLAPHQTTQGAWRRAYADLLELIGRWNGMR